MKCIWTGLTLSPKVERGWSYCSFRIFCLWYGLKNYVQAMPCAGAAHNANLPKIVSTSQA